MEQYRHLLFSPQNSFKRGELLTTLLVISAGIMMLGTIMGVTQRATTEKVREQARAQAPVANRVIQGSWPHTGMMSTSFSAQESCTFDSVAYVRSADTNQPLVEANGAQSGFSVHWQVNQNGTVRQGDAYFAQGQNTLHVDSVPQDLLNQDVTLNLIYPTDQYDLVGPYCNQTPAESDTHSQTSVCRDWSQTTVITRYGCGKTMDYGWKLRRKPVTAELRLDEEQGTFYKCWSVLSSTTNQAQTGGIQGGSVQRGDNSIRCRGGYDQATDTLRVELQLKDAALARRGMTLTVNPNRCTGTQERCESTRAMQEIHLQGVTLNNGADSDGSGGDKAVCLWKHPFTSTASTDVTCTGPEGRVSLPTPVPQSSLQGTISTFSININGQEKLYSFSPANTCSTASRTEGPNIPGLRIQQSRNSVGEVTQVQIHLENEQGVGHLQVGLDEGCACWAGASGVGICDPSHSPTASKALFDGCFGDTVGKLTCTAAGCTRSSQGALNIHCDADRNTPIPPPSAQVCQAAGEACQPEDYSEACGNGGTRLCHKRNGVCSGPGNASMCSWGAGSYCEACSDGSTPATTPVPTVGPGGALACNKMCDYSEGEGAQARCFEGRCRAGATDCGFNVNCENAQRQCGSPLVEKSCRGGTIRGRNGTNQQLQMHVCKIGGANCVDRTVEPGQEVFINVTPDEYEIRGGRPSEGVVGMIQNLFGFGTNSTNSDDVTVTGTGCQSIENGGCRLTINPTTDATVSLSLGAPDTKNVGIGLEFSEDIPSGSVIDYSVCVSRFAPIPVSERQCATGTIGDGTGTPAVQLRIPANTQLIALQPDFKLRNLSSHESRDLRVEYKRGDGKPYCEANTQTCFVQANAQFATYLLMQINIPSALGTQYGSIDGRMTVEGLREDALLRVSLCDSPTNSSAGENCKDTYISKRYPDYSWSNIPAGIKMLYLDVNYTYNRNHNILERLTDTPIVNWEDCTNNRINTSFCRIEVPGGQSYHNNVDVHFSGSVTPQPQMSSTPTPPLQPRAPVLFGTVYVTANNQYYSKIIINAYKYQGADPNPVLVLTRAITTNTNKDKLYSFDISSSALIDGVDYLVVVKAQRADGTEFNEYDRRVQSALSGGGGATQYHLTLRSIGGPQFAPTEADANGDGTVGVIDFFYALNEIRTKGKISACKEASATCISKIISNFGKKTK